MSDLVIWSLLCIMLGWFLRGTFGWWEISFHLKYAKELYNLYLQKVKDLDDPKDKDESRS